jgi:uncharacterized repeat protein (TIGR02543 family)
VNNTASDTLSLHDALPFSTRPVYTFQGWHSAETGGEPFTWPHTLAENVTMHAQWTVTTYTITVDTHGGTELEAITRDTGTPVSKPADPTRTGYTFQGWHSAASGGEPFTWPHTLTGNVTMHAQWAGIPYTIIYELNGGTSNAPENPPTYTTENAVILAAPTRPGYGFEGWHDNSGLTGSVISSIPAGSMGNKTFYASWAVAYAITYELNGGTNVPENPAAYTGTSVVTLAEATRDKYTFGGWYDNIGLTGTPLTIIPVGSSGSKTFYAWWIHNVPINVSVWVNEGDGTILISNADVTISKTSNGYSDSFTADVTGDYTAVQWYFDGAPIPGSEGSAQSITINAVDYVAGTYVLGIRVDKDGIPYSTDFRFTVTN